jgi:hypothetical protein
VLLTHCPNNDCFSMSEHQHLSYDLDQSQGWGAYVGPLVEVCDRWNALWRRHGSGVGPWDHIYFEETRDSRYRLVGFRNLRAGGTVGETLLGPFELPASRYRGDPDVLTVDGDVYVIGEARSQILNRDNGANHIKDTYWEAENGISCAKAPTIFGRASELPLDIAGKLSYRLHVPSLPSTEGRHASKAQVHHIWPIVPRSMLVLIHSQVCSRCKFLCNFPPDASKRQDLGVTCEAEILFFVIRCIIGTPGIGKYQLVVLSIFELSEISCPPLCSIRPPMVA